MSSPIPDRAAIVNALSDELGWGGALSVLFSQAVADRVGINPTDLESLDILRRSGPITAGRLAELTGLTTGAITGLVDRLERLGYARREPDPTDRRRVIVRALVENAERELGPPFAAMAQAMDDLFARYGDDELRVILDFTTRANAIVFDQIARVRTEAAAKKQERVQPAAGATDSAPS